MMSKSAHEEAQRAIEALLDAPEPSSLLVTGAPNTGKTALALWALETALAHESQAHDAQAHSVADGTASSARVASALHDEAVYSSALQNDTLRSSALQTDATQYKAMRSRVPKASAVLVVSHRHIADELSRMVIEHRGVLAQARPVTTLSAVAYRLISAARARRHEPMPKLLNGAEQDALLRQVLARHVQHVSVGDDCDTCDLLREYFASAHWAQVLGVQGAARADELNGGSNGGLGDGLAGGMSSVSGADSASDGIGMTSAALFSQGMTDEFIRQLRDMLARIDELGMSQAPDVKNVQAARASERVRDANVHEGGVFNEAPRAMTDRLRLQWRLAFTLRDEYWLAIDKRYPREYRLDTSRLLSAASALLEHEHNSKSTDDSNNNDNSNRNDAEHAATLAVPHVLIVDSAEDLTLAGWHFVEQLAALGSRIVLMGNPDEAVQSFRGAYPEYSFQRAVRVLPRMRVVALRAQVESDGQNREKRVNSESAQEPTQESTSESPSESTKGTAVEATSESAQASDASSATPPTQHQRPYQPWHMPYRERVAARVSLSIASSIVQDAARQYRYGKYDAAIPGVLPIRANAAFVDDTLQAQLYRQASAEQFAIVQRMKFEHVYLHRRWADMALIAHDNAVVRALGEQLEHAGVPVQYSSVHKPLREEPFVQGLFAMIELAQALQPSTSAASGAERASSASSAVDGERLAWLGTGQVREAVAAILASPLITTATHHAPVPLRAVETVMQAIVAMAHVVHAEDAAEDTSVGDADAQQGNAGHLHQLIAAWRQWRQAQEALRQARRMHAQAAGQYSQDTHNDADISDASSEAAVSEAPLSMQALYTMLLASALPDVANAVQSDAPSATSHENTSMQQATARLHEAGTTLIAMLQTIAGKDERMHAFAALWHKVSEVAQHWRALHSDEPQFVLWEAWKACGVAQRWQIASLDSTSEARAASERLDVAMRLFEYAATGDSADDIMSFIAMVRSQRIEADSLAHTAPVTDAVTLTTPAGAAGRHWKLVWIAGVQQDAWPNLAPRDTLFGAQELAQYALHGELSSYRAMREAVLADEQRSWLVALTRASERVFVSAVANDTDDASDFLYTYMPELLPREASGAAAVSSNQQSNHAVEHAEHMESAEGAGSAAMPSDMPSLDMPLFDASSLVTAARVKLLSDDAMQRSDAANALALLAAQGVESADPQHWAFLQSDYSDSQADEVNTAQDSMGTLLQPIVPVASHAAPQIAAQPASTSTAAASTTLASPTPHEVVLSPSAVDRIWGCPVCWQLERDGGPQEAHAASSFGTMIHAVAQRITEQHQDIVSLVELREQAQSQGITLEKQIERTTTKLADAMMELYHELAKQQSAIANPQEQYFMHRKARAAQQIFTNMAHYFIASQSETLYLGKNAEYFHIGEQVTSYAEMPFDARLDVARITRAWNAMPGVETPMHESEMLSVLAALVGGFPSSMHLGLRVRLVGRMDRVEVRVLPDGARQLRVVDYKTGAPLTGKDVFSDLQLACYQIGLQYADNANTDADTDIHAAAEPFAEPNRVTGLAGLTVAQSDLFYVYDAKKPHARRAPGWSYSTAEGLHQPPLFLDGHLNQQPFTQRFRIKSMSKLFTDALPEAWGDEERARYGEVREAVWAEVQTLRGTQAIWALTMLGRVMYAAAASIATSIVAHPTAQHRAHCRMKTVCPACMQEMNCMYAGVIDVKHQSDHQSAYPTQQETGEE